MPCFQQHVKCLDSVAICDVWSLKSVRDNLRRVEILPYFDTHSMDQVNVSPENTLASYNFIMTSQLIEQLYLIIC